MTADKIVFYFKGNGNHFCSPMPTSGYYTKTSGRRNCQIIQRNRSIGENTKQFKALKVFKLFLLNNMNIYLSHYQNNYVKLLANLC